MGFKWFGERGEHNVLIAKIYVAQRPSGGSIQLWN